MSYTNPHADDSRAALAATANRRSAGWELQGRQVAGLLAEAMPEVDPAIIGSALLVAGGILGFCAKDLVDSHGATNHVAIPLTVMGFAGSHLYSMAQTEKEPMTVPEPDLAVVRQALEEVDLKLIGFEPAEPSSFDVANLYDAVRHLRTAVAALAGIAPDDDQQSGRT